MSVVRLAVGVTRVLWDSARGAKAFFVKWFLPLPAVENLEEHHKWSFDDEDEESPSAALPGRDVEHTQAAIAVPPAPAIRAPEGAEDRQARQPNMPNPFA